MTTVIDSTEPGLQADSQHICTWAIILAAGSGSRMAEATGGIAKQFLQWRGRPLYWHSALTFSRSCRVDGIVFVLPQADMDAEKERIAVMARDDGLGLPWLVAPGGARRQDSCRNGLALVPISVKKVLVHDAARPFVSASVTGRVCEAVSPALPCIVPAVAVTDTIKAASGGLVRETLARERLVACQTPQGFWASALRQALADAEAVSVTDEATLLEKLGLPVGIVAGALENMKITTANDLKILANDAPSWMPCNGFGYDVHRFGPGRPLVLGGVPIPGGLEVIAHSDGDVVLHALMDAVLGAAGLGDIGRHFPDTEQAFSGISSAILLDRVLELANNIKICHVDLSVVAQHPRLAPYATEIARNVARLLGLPHTAVNFKATTEEKMGFTGRREGIKAYALASCITKNC